MKKYLIFLVLIVFLSTFVIAEDVNKVGDWWGTVTIDGNTGNDGAIVDAYINSVKVASATVGQYASGYYLMHIEGNTGNMILFKVNGNETTTTAWSTGDHRLDLTFTSPPAPPSPQSGGGSSGGGSGGGGGGGSSSSTNNNNFLSTGSTCSEKWQCNGWSECVSPGVQTRVCTDTNVCGTTVNKPTQSQDCDLTTQASTNFLTGVVTGVTDFVKSGGGITTIFVLITIVVAGIAISMVKKSKRVKLKNSEVAA